MDQAAFAVPGDAGKKRAFRIGVKGLMIAVACCALITWAGLSIRDHWEGYRPLRAIRAGNTSDRLKAAQDLANERGIDDEAAMTALIHALDDEDARVRAAAAESLGVLVYQLLRVRPPSRPAASELIRKWIDVATRGLVLSLSDRDPRVRIAAATALGTMAQNPNPAPPTDEQVAALRDQSIAVRRRAARQVKGFPDETPPPELVEALRDESAEVRAAAARALARFGPDLDRETPTLLAMLGHDETNVRKACDEALEAAWPNPALVSTLIESLASRDRTVRFHAAQLLGRIGPEASDAIPALIAALKEPSGSTYADPARGAARALGLMGPRPEAIAALVEMIAPEKVDRVLEAMHEAVKPGPPKAGRVTWVDESYRLLSAIQGLGDIGPPAVAATPAVIAAYDKVLRARLLIAEEIPAALGRIAPNSAAAPDAVTVLLRALDSNDSSYYLGAIEALGHFGADASAAIPKLRAIRDEFDRSIPRAAAKSGAVFVRPGTSVYISKEIRDAAAKSLAALEARSAPDAGARIPAR
jgi:HEAT repeat protein